MAKNSFWEEENHVGEADTGLLKKYKVGRNMRRDTEYISIKEWFCRDREDEWYPAAKQGINLEIEIAREVHELMGQAIAEYDALFEPEPSK